MPPVTLCPSVELLRRSLDPNDAMTEAERQRIAAHVDCCTQGCKQALDAVLRGNTLVSAQGGTRPDNRPGILANEAGDEPLPPQMGRYQIVGRLGVGGMGAVFRGHDPQLGRDVAVKVPSFRGSDEARTAARQRFVREARAAAAVRHAHVCPLYDVGEQDGRPFVVMALVEGETLAERLRRQGRFEEPRTAVELLLKIADALVCVHAARIVHRDLKPGNILLDRAGEPFLADFGLARVDDAEQLTSAHQIMGTPAYMAPEQVLPELGPVGPCSDQYSLGVVLYQMLTSRLPFEGSAAALIYQIGSKSVPPPSQHRPDLDPVLERVLLKALARSPQDRHGSVLDFAHALRVWRDRLPTPSEHHEPQRRRLTMLQCGCDLFESEAILTTLDPEDQHELLLAFQQLCREVADQFGGTVVKATNDGLLICFGFPVALEGAAQRAVRAGLHLLERMAALNDGLRQRNHVSLSSRVAIHSDLAVVQENTGPREAISIVGQVLPLVDQLEHLAAPDTLVISDDVHQLVKGYFECSSLGPQKLKGSAGAKPIYRVQRELAVGNRVDVAGAAALTPLIGRDREVALLQGRWDQAVEGMGQVVLLVGEPGIGKSRLVHVLKEYVAGQRAGGHAALIIEWPCTSLQDAEGYRFHAIGSFEGMMGLEPHDGPPQKLEKLVAHLETLHLASAEAVALLASLLSIPLDGRYPPLGMSPLRQKEKTFDLLLNWLREQAHRQPVLFVVEDLHWSGPTNLEFLEILVGQAQSDRILTMLTCRPEFQPPWKGKAHHTQVSLNRLTRRQTGELMAAKTGLSEVPRGVLDLVADRTDGVPLFVEEFAAMLREAGSLYAVGGRPQLSDAFEDHVIPATLQDLLLARLERAAGNVEVVQLAAALGREFSYELLQAVAPWDEEVLHEELARLVEAELLFARGRPPRISYQFKHALIQDAAYQSLLKKKRQQFHVRIAEALEQRFPETCAAQPELLAHHCTEGNLVAEAVENWARAGERAQRRGAYVEAVSYFRRGLDLVRTLPETNERHPQEIRLHLGLGMALEAPRGSSTPEVETQYARAHALCQQSGVASQLFAAVYGRYRCWHLQAQHVRAQELAEELLAIAGREQDTGFLVCAHRAIGRALFFQGRHSEARSHLEKVLEVAATAELRAAIYRYDVADPWVFAYSYLSSIQWLMGRPERAAEQSRQALSMAEGLEHTFSVAVALRYACWVHQFCHDLGRSCTTAERVLTLAWEKGLATPVGQAKIFRGWTMAQRGQSEPGVAEIREGLADMNALGANMAHAYYLALLAEAYARAGRLEEGLKALAEAQEFADATSEGFWQPEIHRLKGELLLQHDPAAIQDAEACFHQALEGARRQQARSLELRAAMSLARLWCQQGKTQPACALVEQVYGSFTEGFQTYDLQTAAAFLKQYRGEKAAP